MDLRAKLAALRATTIEISKEDREEAELRAELAKEERRIADERKAMRDLENARILDDARARAKGMPCQLVDLDPVGERPKTIVYQGGEYGVATRYVVGTPTRKDVSRMFAEIEGLKKGDGQGKLNAMARLVRSCLLFPEVVTEADATALEMVAWDKFSGDITTLGDTALTLAGVRSAEERKSG